MLNSASSVLLQSKMFYVPFLICKTPEQMPGNASLNNCSLKEAFPVFKLEQEQHEETDSEENYEKGSTSTADL